jgi:protein involved in polysaccharide export with SLBB domain
LYRAPCLDGGHEHTGLGSNVSLSDGPEIGQGASPRGSFLHVGPNPLPVFQGMAALTELATYRVSPGDAVTLSTHRGQEYQGVVYALDELTNTLVIREYSPWLAPPLF